MIVVLPSCRLALAVCCRCIGSGLAVAQDTALFLTSKPFSPDPGTLPVPPALEGLTLPASLVPFLENNHVLDVVAWDFDGDGDKDMLLCGSGRLFLLRNGPGVAAAPLDQPWGVFSDASHLLATPATQWGLGGTFVRDFIVEAAAVGDLDGDGREDLVLASSQTTQVIFMVTSPGGTLTLNVPTLNTSPSNWAGTFGWQRAESIVTELVLADVKGGAQGSGPPDGILDLVVARGDSYHTDSSGTTYFPGRALVAINSGNGIDFVDGSPPGLPLQSSTPLDCNAMCISVVDVDGQHGPDLFLGVMGTLGPGGAIVTGQNRLFVNRPIGWQEASGAFPNTLVTSVLRSRPIDFDGDAIPDFAIVSGVDTRVLVGSAAGIWASGAQVLLPPHTRSLAHDLATADFDHDGIPDLLDPSGAFWTGSAAGLVSNNVVVTNQIVTLRSHPGVPFGMRGAVADYDLDGDMDWAGVSISPAGQPQFEIWANVTRQLDFDVISQSNTLVISASTLPLATQFWCYDRSPVPQTVYVLPFLAADLGALPVRIPVQPFEGLVGLDPSTAVSIGGVTGLVLQNANPGELQRDYVPLTFPASIPLGSIIFYQALNIRITGAATGGAFTNVLRVSIES